MTFEDKLRCSTRTPQEIKQAEYNLFIERLTQAARIEVEHFKQQCTENAKNGLNSCSVLSYVWINHDVTADDFYGEDYVWLSSDDGGSIYSKDSINAADEELFLNLLRNALLEENFERATINKHPIYKNRTTYSRHRRLFNIKVKSHTNQVLFAERFCISTNW